MLIRKEQSSDYRKVFELIQSAFEKEMLSDHQEHFLVERLRKSSAFIPELSLVAEIDNKIVGYILLTKIKIKNDKSEFESLALAPVAVLRSYQNRGVGGELIRFAHQKAKEIGFKSVVVLGHEDYYPKFGYKMTKKFDIQLPFDVPDENCFVLELTENALKNRSGIVEYPKEFNE